MLNIARQWVEELGVSVIPIRAKSKKPALRWRPYIDRLPRPDELLAWWPGVNGNGYGIAVIAGHADLAILDFDNLWAYSCWLANLRPALAKIALLTYRVRTSRGVHIYVFSGESAESRSYKNEGLGYDIKGNGGYCLAPPTIHPSGTPYIAIGQPANIQHIDSIYELVPSALKVREAAEAISNSAEEEPDLWDLAMRSSLGISIEEIKKHFTIAGLLSRPSNGNGRRWTTLCPLHTENTPSFTVFPDGHCKCFGCGWRGDVVDLFAALHNLSNRDAIREMASQI